MSNELALLLVGLSGAVLLWLHRRSVLDLSSLNSLNSLKPHRDAVAAELAGRQAPLLRKVLLLYKRAKAREFPGVRDLALSAILRRIRDGDATLVLVDWRTPGEYLDSLLPGAILKSEFLREPERYFSSPGVQVVFYCAIGGRSGNAVQEFAEKHPKLAERVYNFPGSLMAYTACGGELVTPHGESTDVVVSPRRACACYFNSDDYSVIIPETDLWPAS